MLSEVTLRIPQNLFARAKQLTRKQSEKSPNELLEVLDQILASADINETDTEVEEYGMEDDPALRREMQAYVAMHPMLKKAYFGKHVAILQGKLIDSDDDYDTLTRRIDARYPDRFVWISTVEE